MKGETLVVRGTYITVEENNMLWQCGFRYKVKGDWYTLDTYDPWSGMPNVDGNTHFFTEKEDAEAYAKTVEWVFNKDVHGTVYAVVKEETYEEAKARREAEEKAIKEAKARKEAEKAEAVGMTVEEYKAMKKLEAKKRRYAREIKKMEAEIEALKKEIEYKKNFLENN